jgi:hypothetical protein
MFAKVIESKYPARLGNIYRVVLVNELPYYITKKGLKVKFIPKYEFLEFIHIKRNISNIEICEIIHTNNMSEIQKDIVLGNTVTLRSGKSTSIDNTIKIGEYYYEKEKDVVLIEDKWVLKNNNIVKCEISGEYDYIVNMDYGIIGKSGEHLVKGFFKKIKGNPNLAPLITTLKCKDSKLVAKAVKEAKEPIGIDIHGKSIYSEAKVLIPKLNIRDNLDVTPDGELKQIDHTKISINLDSDILGSINAKEAFSHGVFYTPEAKGVIVKMPRPTYISLDSKKKRTGNIEIDIENGTDSKTFNLLSDMQYTFGVEIETSSGIIPAYVLKTLNVESMRDGSIDSGEYVTGVLKGDAGLVQLNKLMYEISKRCSVNRKCGIHVHIGSADFDIAFIVAAYKLGLAIQNDLKLFLAPSRFNNKYCKNLKNLEFTNTPTLINDFNKIVEYLAHGKNVRFITPADKYPIEQRWPHGVGWGVEPRYVWLNLIPTVFVREDRNHTPNSEIVKDKKLTHTIEFRNHHITRDFNSVYTWVLFCMSFVRFIEENKNEIATTDIGKYSISDILNSISNVSLRRKIINDFEERKDKFKIKELLKKVSEEKLASGEYDVSIYEEETKTNNIFK